MTRYDSCSDFQYISENVMCLLQGSCICLLNLVNNERKFLFISCCETLGEVRFELAAGGQGRRDAKVAVGLTTEVAMKGETNGERDGEMNEEMNAETNDGRDNVEGRYSPYPVRKISCSEKEHAMAVVIHRGSGDLLCYLVFDEANGLNSFEVLLTHRVRETIKDVTLGDGKVYLLLKRRREPPLQEGALSGRDNTGKLSDELDCKLPCDADYLICALKLASNKKEENPEVIATHKSSSRFKKMMVCPYNGKKIILVSKRSVFFVATSNEQPSKGNVTTVSKELFLNSPIVATSWLDFHVFTICLSNNELLFFDLSTNSRHLPRVRCHNSYSRICSIFYQPEYLFVAFATKEIVCFRVNYGALPPAAFRQVTPVEENYVSTKCLFQKRQENRKAQEKPSMEAPPNEPGTKEAKGNELLNKRGHIRRKPPKQSRTTFESILNEIKEVENKINDKGFNLLEESDREGRVDDEQAWDTVPFAECVAGCGSSMDGYPSSRDYYSNSYSSGGDNPTNKGKPSKRAHRKKDLSQMRKKRKGNFAKFHYDEDNLTHIFTPISVVNFERYVTHRINSICLHRENLIIQLENGLSYYTTTFDRNRMCPSEDSSFYLCGHTALHKIKEVKVGSRKEVFTLDEARMLKCYSITDNQLSFVCTGRGIKWFDVLSMKGECNCLFVALTDGSFFFINLMSCKILLYGSVRRHLGGGRGRGSIECALFNKVNEHIFNGYFKMRGALLFFFLIHSVSHQKMFIYFVHEVLIGRLLARLCDEGGGNKDRSDERGQAAQLLLSLSTYRRSDVNMDEDNNVHVDNDDNHGNLDRSFQRDCDDYACLLTATGDLGNFYLLFVQLIKKEFIMMRKKNWETNVRILYWKMPHKNVVYGKVIGSYLVLVDFHLNVRFFYLNKVTFGEVSSGDLNEVASLLSGKKTSFLRRLKRPKGSRREGMYGPNDEENAFEEFILKRRRRRNTFRPDGVNEDSDTPPNEQSNGEEKSPLARLFRINLGEEDLHIDLSHTGKAQFINERMEGDAAHICSFHIVTDSNIVITFSFDSGAYPLQMVKPPEVDVSSIRETERINFFHPMDMKGGTYNLFLTKGRHFRLEGASCSPGMAPRGGHQGSGHKRGNHERVTPLQDNYMGGNQPKPQALTNGDSSFELICQKDIYPTMQATLARISEGGPYASDVNFFLRQPSVVFLKVYCSALRKRLRDKRGKTFQERVSVEWGVASRGHRSAATKEVLPGDDKVTSSAAATSADAPASITSIPAIHFIDTPRHTNFFFDNETTIFTFLNENEYRLPLEECLNNYENKSYLSTLHAKRKEEREQIEKLRNQLNELISQNENSSTSIKLDRKNFFLDKKIINESEILINEYEQIKKKFEKKKLAKEYLIKNLEKKCSPLAQVDFLFGLNTNVYVTNASKKSNYHQSSPIREKIKLLRFLQIKESDFFQNVEKNNILCFLKTTKDYIDRYTEDFSSLFFSHYYPCTNMNLNYLYANLFGSSFSASGVDNVQWNYLLYFPCELFTNARKRLQCYVLQMLIDQQKAKFRSHFLALKEEKKNYVEEISLVSNKLKLSLEATEKYFSHPYSHLIHPGLYNRGALKGVNRDALPVSKKFDPDVLLRMHLHKLKVESQMGDAFDEHGKGDLTMEAQKKGDHFAMGASEQEADKEPPKDTSPCENEADQESVEIHEKKKNDVRNALSDVKSYIYQISDQCEEFNEKLKQLRKKKYNIQKLIKLHELYCIATYATLINEERKEEALRQIEKKRTAVEGQLLKLEESMRQLDVLQKHRRNFTLSELLTRKKQKFEKRFLHECSNFDVLMEQKYENVIGFDFDSRKNLFIRKKIIQKHIADTNQIIHENFELRRSIRKLKHEICRNKIKKDYLHFSLMDIEEGVDDVKYLKQNCEFLFSDINNVISSLEVKKKNRKLIFQMSEQKLREQISNVDAKISAIKSENVVLEANMRSLLKEISQMGKATQGDQTEDATHLLETKGNLEDDNSARAGMSFKCSDADVEGETTEENESNIAPDVEKRADGENQPNEAPDVDREMGQENEPNGAAEQNRDDAHKQAPDLAAAPGEKKQTKLRIRDIHEKSALLRKKYK
ncbi:hypothetical protein C922_02761 [Plasmodium inui San Antonio 1]|uniref:Uncharacterized protein n=1 Tax=Plasmodium inui San Antonio 1 TaxID=1237626 RepID=W7AN87_9APIC|nr:hypothetical protein C922_02761 [Plasmodium inui San Antonio 1]EUD66776.1 hypothetical protein C922_02761 [Plasmodium inui San Antonio 1]